MMNDRTQRADSPERKGFTVIELIISIAVIAVLITLVVIGVQAVKKRAGGLIDATSVDQVFTGVKQFKQEVGFLPPVVKEFAGGGSSVEQMIIRQAPLPWTALFTLEPPEPPRPARHRIGVYSRGSNAQFFKGDDPLYVGPTPGNFLQDNRFSQLTLAYYVASQLEFGYNTTLTDVPVDGIAGPGMYKPEKGGIFDVPESMLKGTPADRKRQGKVYGPYVEAAGKSVKVETDTATDASGRDVTVRDRNGVPIRYYYWLPKPAVPNGDPDVDMALPRMVCRVPNGVPGESDPVVPDQFNPKTNAVLRNATWAVVAAGPDKVFGDEDIDYIAQVLGKTPPGANFDENRKLRLQAAKDNIVRLGTED